MPIDGTLPQGASPPTQNQGASPPTPPLGASPPIGAQHTEAPVRSITAILHEKLKFVDTIIGDNLKFSGELPSGESSDLAKMAASFYHVVEFAITSADIDCAYTNLVALRLLKDRALTAVMDSARQKGEGAPSWDTIREVIIAMTEGTAIGPITQTERIWSLELKSIAMRLYNKRKEIPDLNRCIAEAQQELSKREKMAVTDQVYFWLVFLREFPSLAKEVRLTNINGRMVEQTDPAALLTTLLSFNFRFKELMEAEIKGKRPIESGPSGSRVPSGSAPKSSGPSKSAWQTVSSRTNQRSAPGHSSQRVSGGAVRTSCEDPNFDPFKKFRLNQLSATPRAGYLFWIKDSSRATRSELAKERKCYLCKSDQHPFVNCPTQLQAFREKRFCFFPTTD